MVLEATYSEPSVVASYQLASDTDDCSNLPSYQPTTPQLTDAGFTDGDVKKLCLKLVDDAGNISYDETTSFIVDKQAPVISSVSLQIQTLTDGKLDNLEAVLSSNLYTITATGYTSLESDIVATPTVVTSTVCSGAPYNTDIEKSNDTSLSAIQNYTICVRASDDAGNIATNFANSLIESTRASMITS